MMHKLISYYGFSRMPFAAIWHRACCIATARTTKRSPASAGASPTAASASSPAKSRRQDRRRARRTSEPGSQPPHHHLPARPHRRVQGIHHRIVASLGGQPLTHHATLAPQAADALAAEQAERGRTPVVVVEEAHLLGYDQLEALRLLTNHDLDSSSPFACLLIGQPTLRRRMKLGVLAALDQRIGLRYAMPPMTDTNTGSYLRHHLKLADATMPCSPTTPSG